MNIKSHANESSQQQSGQSDSNNEKDETNDEKPEGKEVHANANGNGNVVIVVVVDKGGSKVDVATTTNYLNVEAIERASASTALPALVAINERNGNNNNNCNSSASNESDACNKIKKQQQQQQRKTLNEKHSKYNNKSAVQIFTNTKELNQDNLNSSSTTASQSQTARATATAAKAAPDTELRQQQQLQLQQQQPQQLIMSPATAAIATASGMPAKLRKSHSTPTLKFDGSNIVDERIYSNNNNSNKNCEIDAAIEASNNVCSERQQQQRHDQFSRVGDSSSSHNNSNNHNNVAATPTTPEALRFGCTHYKRRAMFVTPCCNKFYKCRFCHDENESHHFDRKTLTELICSECNTRQKVQEQCEKCAVRFGKYTCLICNLFDDADKQQYHCHGCGICRIGGAHNFFHCEVCNMCLPIQLKIDGHRCVENISRSHCPVCLGDIHTSRIPCHIPDCGHLLHKMCFDQLLASGHYTCPTCQTSLIDMTALWEYLDAQALRMPVPLKYENQRVHIFCNDCHKTSKTKFHFIGLKCVHCGAYNTTQDVKRRLSLVTDEPSSA